MSFDIHCAGIVCDKRVALELPRGWTGDWSSEPSDPRGVLCSECEPDRAFFEAQCPGCVQSPGECALWKLFAFSNSTGLSHEQRATVAAGRCPVRTNGTSLIRWDGHFERLDLSEPTTTEHGARVVARIAQYMEKYGRAEAGTP